MKILMINKFLHKNGGSETYVFNLGKYLQAAGHEVQYFGMEHQGRCVGNAANAYTKDMDFHGGSFMSKIMYPVKTIYSLEARKKIRLVLNDFQPDVCHLNNFNYQLTPSIIMEIVKWRKENRRSCRIIFTAHDYQLICPNHMLNNPDGCQNCEKCLGGHFVNCIKGKCIHGSRMKSAVGALEAFFWNKKGTYEYIDKIICCSYFMKQKMDSNDIFSKKTVVMHNFVPDSSYRAENKKDYILYFGRLSKEKGVETLVQASRELPEIPFVFAGTGPLEDMVKDVENIEYKGFVTGEKLKILIGEAVASVYPSEWYENCPFSVMESQMYGTPVIASDIGGIPELVQEKKTGVLFKSGDIRELKEKIVLLWNDRPKALQYSRNCTEIKFDTVKSYAEKLFRLYEGKE